MNEQLKGIAQSLEGSLRQAKLECTVEIKYFHGCCWITTKHGEDLIMDQMPCTEDQTATTACKMLGWVIQRAKEAFGKCNVKQFQHTIIAI